MARTEPDRAEIEREVRRLSPWYFRFDLGGVKTDITPSIADRGHRDIAFPDVRDGYWRGKRVLDIACNEGAYSFAALARGAAHVDGFDVRESNIEKARFAQRVLGHAGVDFHVSTIDDWFDAHPEPYDHVLCCGILYHLVDPPATIARVAASARESILVTCVLYGGDEIGYTRYAELDNAAASANALDSLAPNNTATLIAEFARHGFHPLHVSETRGGDLWGGCNLLLWNAGPLAPQASPYPRPFDVHLVPCPTGGVAPAGKLALNVTLYNWATEPVAAEGRLSATDATGRTLCEIGPSALDFPARVAEKGDLLSKSIDLQLDLDVAGAEVPITLVAELRERAGGALLGRRTLVRR
jgi:SAM-dependent methyltransferase